MQGRRITSKAFGIGRSEPDEYGRMIPYVRQVIDRYSVLPITGEISVLRTDSPGQRSVLIELYEQADGNVEQSEDPADNIKIATVTLSDLPPNLPEGEPIHIRFQLAEDGTLDVHVWMPNQGNRVAKINTKITGIMSEEEVKGRGQL